MFVYDKSKKTTLPASKETRKTSVIEHAGCIYALEDESQLGEIAHTKIHGGLFIAIDYYG